MLSPIEHSLITLLVEKHGLARIIFAATEIALKQEEEREEQEVEMVEGFAFVEEPTKVHNSVRRTKRRNTKRIPDEKRKEIMKLRRDNLSYSQISSRTGVSMSSVAHIITKG